MIDQIENLIATLEESGRGFSGRDCLFCIEVARQEMLAGRTSVETYYKAKNILLELVECASIIEN